ncbi:MAG: VOC family protein [Niveispirillum sp.]|uniref:VOC family protein n=1 Tax=Alphaproteobacteria TaxID=28211 RepID=UPI00263807DB|nr:VOC family protein [Asticcacaulis sp.]
MIDHIELKTADMPASLHFYSIILAPLGYRLEVDGAVKGFGDGKTLDFFLSAGDVAARDVHYAFTSPDRATIDRIYEVGAAQGLRLDRAPALMPHVHASYYAGFLRDPDGRLVEFACHKAE